MSELLRFLGCGNTQVGMETLVIQIISTIWFAIQICVLTVLELCILQSVRLVVYILLELTAVCN